MKTFSYEQEILRGASLIHIAFVLSNLAFLAQVKAVDPMIRFYGGLAGNGGTTGLYDSGFGYGAFYTSPAVPTTRPSAFGAPSSNTEAA